MIRKTKDSGFDWIGHIPDGWELKRMKDAGQFQTGKDFKHLSKGNVPVFGSSKEPFAFVNKSMCVKKSLAIGRKGTIDSPFVLPNEFWAVDTCMYLTVTNLNFDFQFLSYWMNIIPWVSMSTKTALPSLTQTDVNNAVVAFPPLKEQQAIAAFLDRETMVIDRRLSLIGQKKQLLAELRKSTIHEAVTKGLDRSVPMKDSGIVETGYIPYKWIVTHLKDVVIINMGQSPESKDVFHKEEKDGVPFIQGCSEFSKTHPLPVKTCVSPRKTVSKGDILFSVRAPVGRVNIADTTIAIGRGICGFTPKKINGKFLFYFSGSVLAKSLMQDVTGSTFEAVSVSNIASSKIISPSLEEQQAIVDFLDRETSLIDRQIEALTKMEGLLIEQRKALIHEVVTGKIEIS